MSSSSKSPQLERICALLLARLLAMGKRAMSRRDVIKSVHGLLVAALGPSVQAGQVEAALDHCTEHGWIAQSPLALRDEGRDELRQRLGVQQLPRFKDWRQVQQRLLPSLMLGTDLQTKGRGADRVAAAIVASMRELPAENRSLKAVLDALAWRALGEDSDAPFDAGRVQRWLLRDLVAPDVRVKTGTWRRLVAAKLIGAPRADATALHRALLARWLQPPPEPRPERAQVRPVGNPTVPSLSAFAKAVLRSARLPGVTRFHGDRAFIGSIWEHMRGAPPIGAMTLAEFKGQLVQAHRKGLIHMTRADLVGAMDPLEVRRSEARYLDASFHFVALDPEQEPAL